MNKNIIKNKLIEKGVENLQEFGYPEEQWDDLTKIAMSDNLVDVFGSCFEYLLDEVLDITEIKPKLVPLEAIANQEEYTLPF